MHDKKLVQQFLSSGSDRAFRELYQAKTPRLYQMALRLVANDQYQAEEIVQDMWIIAIKKLGEFQWRSQLNTWLTGILLNLWRDRRKKNDRVHAVKRAMQVEVEDHTQPLIFTKYDLENAISALPPGYRQVVILYDIEGYKHKEIAQLLDINEGTSKSQLYHARRALREYLKDETKDMNHDR